MNEMSSRLNSIGSELFADPMSLVREPNRAIATLISAATLATPAFVGVPTDGFWPEGVEGSSVQYEDPGVDEQQELTGIEQDLQRGLLELRAREAVDYLSGSGPLILDPALQLQAQDAARTNAASGREQPSLNHNVSMIQAHLPVEQASGAAFLDLWLRSQPHTDVILDPAYAFYGVAAVEGGGQVWAVILFSR